MEPSEQICIVTATLNSAHFTPAEFNNYNKVPDLLCTSLLCDVGGQKVKMTQSVSSKDSQVLEQGWGNVHNNPNTQANDTK